MIEETKTKQLLEEIVDIFKDIEELPDCDIKTTIKEIEEEVTKKEG